MPRYEFYCEKCKKEVTLTLSIGARERGAYKCPGLWGQSVAATDGHVLLPDVTESLRGTESGSEG